MSAWLQVLWPLTLASLLVVVPGLVVALAGGFRREAALGVAPALSLGVLAVADIVAAKLHWSWGLPVIAVVTAVAALGAVLVWRLVPAVEKRVGVVYTQPTRPTAAQSWWYAAVTLGAVLAGGYVIARGMGTPTAINQTYDAPFHVNAIELVAHRASAAPDVVASTSSSGGAAGFYPPLFHGVAGLLVMVTGISPIGAANVLAVVIAGVMWPLSVAFLVRALFGSSRLAHLVAMIGSVLIGFFPALLLTFGVLWPNAFSIASLPAVVGLLAIGLRIAPYSWVRPGTALVAGAATLPGIYYAHPGAAFVLLAMAVPMVVAAEARVVLLWWPRGAGRRVAAVAMVVGTVLGAAVFWTLLGRIDSLNRVRAFEWATRATPAHALGEVIALGSPLSPDLWIYGLLVVIGLFSLLHTRSWWVSAAHLLLAWLAILAIAYDGNLSQQLTGFWYNDPFRIMAPLAITAIPLAAAGALAWRDDWAVRLARRSPAWGAGRLRGVSQHSTAIATSVVLVLVALLVPDTFGLSRISRSVAGSYAAAGDMLVSPAESQLYASLARRLAPGQSIAGNPWSGEVYAGVLSGHPVVWRHLSVVPSPELTLLAQRFKDFTSDPRVCAAVKRLKIGVVVEDTHLLWQGTDNRTKDYPGLTNLSGVPGLTLIGKGDTATAYAVGGCRS